MKKRKSFKPLPRALERDIDTSALSLWCMAVFFGFAILDWILCYGIVRSASNSAKFFLGYYQSMTPRVVESSSCKAAQSLIFSSIRWLSCACDRFSRRLVRSFLSLESFCYSALVFDESGLYAVMVERFCAI